MLTRRPITVVRWLALAAALLLGCGDAIAEPPNVLWIVWDTVRADRMSLYGAERPTTPHVEAWAQEARVFEDALSPSSTTLASHASMFTGLLPTEHGAHNGHPYLEDAFTTLAEILAGAGYETFLWSANPNVSALRNLQQGFQAVGHPWQAEWRESARRIVEQKLEPRDRSSDLPNRLKEGRVRSWDIKAAGELAQRALEEWLDLRDGNRPYFAFLNYMEAHRPLIPPRRFRERVMAPGEVDLSYGVDRSWAATWSYTFGLREYDAEELALTAATYDAAIAELDGLFGRLLESLERRGDLDGTIVILTSDHGELLGEHHMLDHQFSLHQVLLRVPLAVCYPGHIAPGRDARAVMSFDLFPTLLELTGTESPPGPSAHAVSLLRPRSARRRLAEYPAPLRGPIATVKRLHPDWDDRPWQRSLRALVDGPHKIVRASDGETTLYDRVADPGEEVDRLASRPELAGGLSEALDERVASLRPRTAAAGPLPVPSEEERELLAELGYGEPSSGPHGPSNSAPQGAPAERNGGARQGPSR